MVQRRRMKGAPCRYGDGRADCTCCGQAQQWILRGLLCLAVLWLVLLQLLRLPQLFAALIVLWLGVSLQSGMSAD